MKICKSCGIEFETGDGNYCCPAHRIKEWRKSPVNMARITAMKQQRGDKCPENKAEQGEKQSLDTLHDWYADRTDEAYKRLVNPRCDIDKDYCNPDDAGYGKCGDIAEGCVWSSFTKKDPRQAAAQSG